MNKTEALKRVNSLKSELAELEKVINAPEKITDRVKTFEDACSITGDNPNDSKFKTGTPDDIAYQKIKVIAKALNEGWIPDINNTSEYKYYPYFTIKSGFGLSYFDYFRWFTCTDVGVRLCFKTSALAEYAGKQFESLYKDYLL